MIDQSTLESTYWFQRFATVSAGAALAGAVVAETFKTGPPLVWGCAAVGAVCGACVVWCNWRAEQRG